jgi:hypothetical protein
MFSIKELAKWLKQEVEFLKENPDYMGSFKKLDDYFAVVLEWQQGYDKEKDDTLIQNPNDMSWALNANIKIWENGSSIEDWLYPYFDDSDEMMMPGSISISPKEDYEGLSEYLLESYQSIEGFVPNESGMLNFDNPPDRMLSTIEPEEIESEELKEENEVKLQTVDSKQIIEEFKKSVFEKFKEHSVYFMDFTGIEPNNDYEANGYAFTVTIDGDWKHAHILAYTLVRDLLEGFGFTFLEHGEQVLPDENNFDDIGEVYISEHTWFFKL